MKCGADIIQLADCKYAEGECLYKDGHFDGAFYIGGYCVELLLKAKVGKTLGIDNFFDDTFLKSKLKYPQTFKSHDLEQLFILSGLYTEFDKELKNKIFKAHWSVVDTWDEDSRYLMGKTQEEVRNFLTSLYEISEWIRKRL